MTLYLTDDTPPEEIARAQASGRVQASSLPGRRHHAIPTRASRASRSCVARARGDAAARHAAAGPRRGDRSRVDVFDREKAFLERRARAARRALPEPEDRARAHHDARGGRITSRCTGPNVAATITAHHLLLNRNALFVGGIRPHHYCLPVLKREEHREALVEAATSGNPEVLPRHRQRAARARAPRRRPAAAPASTPRTRRSSSTPRRSRKPARSTSSRASPATSARTSTACRATRTRSRWCARSGRCRETLRFGGEELVPLRAGETIPWQLA